MRFANPVFLVLIIPLVLAGWYYFRVRLAKPPAIIYSGVASVKKARLKTEIDPEWFFTAGRLLVLFLLILALARPQAGMREQEYSASGIDIILCLDTSTSMRAVDFQPQNRLEAVKEVAREFVKGRKNDRIGVVVFSVASFTQCPLTLDYGAVDDFLEKVEIGMTQTDGTAIGTAIGTSVNRLKDSVAKSKVIILLTDGRNNAGEIDPVTAAKTAAAFGIKIYTIGAGKPGGALYPVDDPVFGRRFVPIADELDEGLLSEIASLTGAKYFRAKDEKSLREIYKQIDQMEKTDIKTTEYTSYTELYMRFIVPAVILLLGIVGLSNTVFRRIP